jgi:hypothetical protein
LALLISCDEGGDAIPVAGSAASSGSGSSKTGFSAELAKAMGSGSASGSAPAPENSAPVVVAPPPPIAGSAPRVYVKPSAELGQIKLSLEPNWDRDVGEAGTISLVVRIPGKDEGRVFSFRYGFDDPKAPTDRDAYKKWLAEAKLMTPTLDRQRGAAWYLEGPDGAGVASFRIVVNYGGKKLVCGGPLYKDAASNQLGDLRDKTLIQAKAICESLSL